MHALDEYEKQKTGAEAPAIWRKIMKSPITKIAAAVVIVVSIGLNEIVSSTPAFAEIIQPFLTAHTATFEVTIEGEGFPRQEYNGMFMEPTRMRYTQPGGGIVIVDLEQGKFVTLLPQTNQAVVLEMINVPEEPGDLNFFQEIRMRILKAQPLDDKSVEFLGEKKLDGQSAIGYRVQKPGLDATVWADSESRMPIHIELFEESTTVTMSNIVFNVELDETLFSLDIPEGYSVHTLRKDLSEPTEEDFVESFRMWAEHMDGKFPSKMHKSAVNEFIKYQQEKMNERGVELSYEDMMQMQQTIVDLSQGFSFVEALPPASDWHYVGMDVDFGDAETAIFWYLPEGSATYRVIYGDLSVKDVAPEDLPQ
jgi:outer membrane lipoprotein-sorting protein